MERTVNFYLRGMELAEPQVYEAMALFPLKSKLNPGPEYLTLSEALDTRMLEITEVSPTGSVPELRATNKGKKAVLLLDGEELVGAKQNRVLNTTIMIGPNSSVIIPVSCVERSRWHGTSPRMERSENVMHFSLRSKKMARVHQNLEQGERFRAD